VSAKILVVDDEPAIRPLGRRAVARARSVLRHRVPVDTLGHKVTRHGQDVHLSRKEFGVLAELARFPGRVLTHAHLRRTLWGEGHVDEVESLRVGVGYRLVGA
jgi:two-component system, OmpR family, KDP operon response regulator KdpE